MMSTDQMLFARLHGCCRWHARPCRAAGAADIGQIKVAKGPVSIERNGQTLPARSRRRGCRAPTC